VRDHTNAGHYLDRANHRIFRIINWLRSLLRPLEVKGIAMNLETIIMLAISALTMAYLLYALLRPEKF
jgi:K+-transporting ATPase KdpF subunit